MNHNKFTRRSFIRGSLSAVAAAGVARTPLAFAAEELHTLRLGGPSFAKTDDPEELALLHRSLGYRAAYCPHVALTDTDRIRALQTAFAKHDVVIAEVGRWCNLLDADPTKRRENLQKVTEGLALAEAIGALDCVDIAGSFNPTSWHGPHPDNLSPRFFDAAVENARAIIDAVKPQRAKFCYEMMGWSLPDSPDSYLRMIKAVDRKAFGVHLDPVNIVNCPARYYHTGDLLNECFDKLGRWIVSCHAKDVIWTPEAGIHIVEIAPGKGVLDYATYLRRLAQLPQNPPLMLEHLKLPEEYTAAREQVRAVGQKEGLRFE